MNISSQTDKLHNTANSGRNEDENKNSFLQKKRESPNVINKEIDDNNLREKKIKENEKSKNNDNDLLDKNKDENIKNNNSNNDKKQNSSDTEIIELNSNTENKNEEKKNQDTHKINFVNNQENENKENEAKKENINIEKSNHKMNNEKNINELMNNSNNNKEEDNLDNNSMSKQLSISIKSIEKLSKNDKVKNLFTSNGLNYEKNIIFKDNIGYEFDIIVCGIRIQMGPFISDRKARSVIRFINQSKHIISAISIVAKKEWFKNLSQMLEELLE